MINRFIVSFLVSGLLAGAPAFADSMDMLIEIYRIAPGKHHEFVRQIVLFDQANAEAGLNPSEFEVGHRR